MSVLADTLQRLLEQPGSGSAGVNRRGERRVVLLQLGGELQTVGWLTREADSDAIIARYKNAYKTRRNIA